MTTTAATRHGSPLIPAEPGYIARRDAILKMCGGRCPHCAIAIPRDLFSANEHYRDSRPCRQAIMAAMWTYGYRNHSCCYRVVCTRCAAAYFHEHPTRSAYCPPCRELVTAEQREAAKRRRRQPRPSLRPCRVCGGTFAPARADAVTCSDACRQRAYRRRVTDSRPCRKAAQSESRNAGEQVGGDNVATSDSRNAHQQTGGAPCTTSDSRNAAGREGGAR